MRYDSSDWRSTSSSSGISLISTLSWSLILSGGLGNLLDRMLHDGHVIDFMNLGIGSLWTGV